MRTVFFITLLALVISCEQGINDEPDDSLYDLDDFSETGNVPGSADGDSDGDGDSSECETTRGCGTTSTTRHIVYFYDSCGAPPVFYRNCKTEFASGGYCRDGVCYPYPWGIDPPSM